MLVNTPIANLYSEPSVGELDDQILYGEEADVLESQRLCQDTHGIRL